MPPQYRALLACLHQEGHGPAPPSLPRLSAEQERELFFEILRDAQVRPEERWHQVVIRIDEDPRYTFVGSCDAKVALFEEYQRASEAAAAAATTATSGMKARSSGLSLSGEHRLVNQIQNGNVSGNEMGNGNGSITVGESGNKMVTPRQAFQSLLLQLLGDGRLSGRATWREASALLQQHEGRGGPEEEFADPLEREFMFEEQTMIWHTLRLQEAEQRSKAGRKRFRRLLEGDSELTTSSYWQQFHASCSRQHPWVAELPMRTKLEVFRQHMEVLEKAEAASHHQALKTAQQQARALRGAFKARLAADHRAGLFDAFCPWPRYRDRVLIDDPSYRDMAGKPGSDARDLYLDFVDDLHAEYVASQFHPLFMETWQNQSSQHHSSQHLTVGDIRSRLDQMAATIRAQLQDDRLPAFTAAFRIFSELRLAPIVHPEAQWRFDSSSQSFLLSLCFHPLPPASFSSSSPSPSFPPFVRPQPQLSLSAGLPLEEGEI
ncbi:MAG: hypothetical protein Q8P67_18060 [archaeon]|nr:hypothetical protein [archaeon]